MICDRIKKLREQYHLSQVDLAKKTKYCAYQRFGMGKSNFCTCNETHNFNG